jgi:hypothetical protein
MRVRLAALGVLGAAIVGMPGAYADTTRHFTYVANSVGYYTDADRDAPAEYAVHGQLRFTPRTSTVKVWIDDRTIPDGQTIAVGGLDRPCLRVRVVETIRGVVPGKEMMMTIFADGAWLPDPGPGCSGHASAGNAEVRI